MASSSTSTDNVKKIWTLSKLVESSHVFTLSKYSLGRPMESIFHVFSTDTKNKRLDWVWKIHHPVETVFQNGVFMDRFTDYLSVFLYLENDTDMNSGEFYSVNIAVSILNRDGNVFHKSQAQYVFHKAVPLQFGWPSYYNKQDILQNPALLMPNGQFKILCELNLWDPCKTVPLSRNSGVQSKILDQLGDLLKSDNPLKFADVTLCIGEIEISAHKFMLSARSPVFGAMFECDMLENRENKVEIKDMDPKILREMLEFIYTGKAPNIEETAQELLVASDRYNIEDLKALAESTLATKLSVNNAADLLMLADTYSAKTLETEAVNFIASNMASVVKMAESWRKMVKEKPQLMALVMESVAEQTKEIVL